MTESELSGFQPEPWGIYDFYGHSFTSMGSRWYRTILSLFFCIYFKIYASQHKFLPNCHLISSKFAHKIIFHSRVILFCGTERNSILMCLVYCSVSIPWCILKVLFNKQYFIFAKVQSVFLVITGWWILNDILIC